MKIFYNNVRTQLASRVTINTFSGMDRLQMLESDVHRRQNLTSKVDSRTERVKHNYTMVVGP